MTESTPPSEPGGPAFAEIADRLRRDADARVVERERRRKRKRAFIGAAAAVGAIAVVVGAITLSGGSGDGTDESAATTAISDPAATAAATEESSLSTDVDTPTTEAPSQASTDSTAPISTDATTDTSVVTSTTTALTTTTPTTTIPPTTTPSVTSVASSIDGSAEKLPVRYAVYEGGKLYLRGSVPDQDTADEIAARAGSVLGPDNVLVEYTIDPKAPLPNNAPVFVADTILFSPGRVDVGREFYGLLDIGVALLAQYPKVHIDVEGFTDDRGTDEYNLELSQKRVDAILEYLASKGADLSRVRGIARGEADPIADNSTPLGQAANRRIEFTIFDLLS